MNIPEVTREQLILIAITVVILGVLGFMFYSWLNGIAEDKKADELSQSAQTVNNPIKPAKPNTMRYSASNFAIRSWVETIKDSIHYFKADDALTILEQMKKCRTRGDLQYLKEILRIHEVNVLDVFKKALSKDQVNKYTTWEKSLPDYIPYDAALYNRIMKEDRENPLK